MAALDFPGKAYGQNFDVRFEIVWDVRTVLYSTVDHVGHNILLPRFKSAIGFEWLN